MLQHDPTAWRKHILPNCKAQLTLSGHTHGGQISLFGWTPISLTYDEWGGWYHEGDRTLFVSTGVGGVVPFRFNLEGEICVITLHKKNKFLIVALLYRIYQLVFFLPICLILTIITGLETSIGCFLGNGHFWGIGLVRYGRILLSALLYYL